MVNREGGRNMTSAPTFVPWQRAKAVAWKQSTGTLPDEARVPAPYFRDGKAQTATLPRGRLLDLTRAKA
jgi:hypothetical protein